MVAVATLPEIDKLPVMGVNDESVGLVMVYVGLLTLLPSGNTRPSPRPPSSCAPWLVSVELPLALVSDEQPLKARMPAMPSMLAVPKMDLRRNIRIFLPLR